MSAVSYKKKYLKRLEEVHKLIKGETDTTKYLTLLMVETLLTEFIADLDRIIGD